MFLLNLGIKCILRSNVMGHYFLALLDIYSIVYFLSRDKKKPHFKTEVHKMRNGE
jgi:hypothetical protein